MLGLTQQQFAVLIGVTYQQAHKYEHGKNRISAGRLYYIAETLKVPIAFFYEGLPGAISLPEIPSRQRICLEAARNFARIQNQHHQEALSHLAKALAGPDVKVPAEIPLTETP